MLKEYQVRDLLRTCECVAGKRLDSVRGNLRSDQKVPTIWELVVFDSLTSLGDVIYEPDSNGSSNIDFCVTFDSGTEIWADAAWVRGRLLDHTRNVNEVIDRIYEHIDQRTKIPVRCVRYRLHGEKTSKGYEHKIPLPQNYKEIIRTKKFSQFLESCNSSPQDRHFCDLTTEGYSIEFHYEWREPGPFETYGGSGPIGDEPSSILDHPLYRTLQNKNDQMRRSGVSKPFIPIVGEHSNGLLHDVFGRRPSVEDVLRKAFHSFVYISGVIIVSLKDSLAGIGEGRSNLEPLFSCYRNGRCREPVPDDDWKRISSISFSRWNYTYAYQPESYARNMKNHRDLESGNCSFGQIMPSRPWTLMLPEHRFRQLLCGEKSFAELGYEGLEGCDKEILSGDRPILNIEFRKGNPREQIPDKILVTFGPRRNPIY